MSILSPATTMALFQPASAASPSAGGSSVDVVTQCLAEQVADGKMSMEQGTALAQAWQQIEDIVSLSGASGAAAFGPGDISQMFNALRPALQSGGVDILA